MSKSVRIREGVNSMPRVDAINILNSPQWSNPNLNINSPNFRRITSASGAREFTLNAD
jgi:hypothetical protein